jgi:uncharacterized protein
MDKNLREYTVSFKGLRVGEHHFHYDLNESFFTNFEKSPIEKCDLKVDLFFDKKSETFFELNFILKGIMELNCDRCLDTFDYSVSNSYRILIKLTTEESEGKDDDIVFLPLDEQQINVAQYIFEFFTVDLPLKQVCSMIDKECNPEMTEKLEGLSGENTQKPEDEIDPRWEALKNLIHKRKN